MSKKPKKADTNSDSGQTDVALLCGVSSDGRGVNILRRRGNGPIQAGVVHPLEEGKPLDGEIVQLSRRGDSPICDIKVHYSAEELQRTLPECACSVDGITPSSATPDQCASDSTPPAAAESEHTLESSGRPAKVTSEAYRKNWDLIWKRPGSSSKKYLN